MKPVAIVETYYRDVWSKHDVGRIPELCADPMIRHDPTGDSTLSHEDQRQRILGHVPRKLKFHIVSAHGDDQFATIVWQLTSAISDYRISGIEVARIIDGRIAEVWNATCERPWE
jgi:hypothetical protein